MYVPERSAISDARLVRVACLFSNSRILIRTVIGVEVPRGASCTAEAVVLAVTFVRLPRKPCNSGVSGVLRINHDAPAVSACRYGAFVTSFGLSPGRGVSANQCGASGAPLSPVWLLCYSGTLPGPSSNNGLWK